MCYIVFIVVWMPLPTALPVDKLNMDYPGPIVGAVIVGGFAGMGLGYLVSRLVNQVPFNVAGLATLPMDYDPRDYFLAFSFGLITTFVAGYFPSRKASRIDPVTIIRG